MLERWVSSDEGRAYQVRHDNLGSANLARRPSESLSKNSSPRCVRRIRLRRTGSLGSLANTAGDRSHITAATVVTAASGDDLVQGTVKVRSHD